MARWWTDDEVSTLRRMRREGATVEAIAEELERTYESAHKKLVAIRMPCAQGAPRSLGRPTQWTDEQTRQLRDLVYQRHSATTIAKAMGFTRNAIIGRCHRLGLKLAGNGGQAAKAATKQLERKALAARAKAQRAPSESVQREPRPERPKGAVADVARVIRRRPAVHIDAPYDERFREGFRGQEGRLSISQLGLDHCRYPIETVDEETGRTETRYCGCQAEPGSSWCPEHAARVFGHVSEKKTVVRSKFRFALEAAE